MPEILITGGAGYIGSWLIAGLVERGHRVRVLDDFSGSDPSNLLGAPGFDFVRGDVREEQSVHDALDGVDIVIHLAAITGAADSYHIEDEVFEVNHGGTKTVLDAAERADVERFVLASSCNVYGEANADYLVETDEPAPRNPYAESKLAAEGLCHDSALETVTLRLATNYGWSPGIRFNLVVNEFVFRALHGEPLTIHGDGSNWRPFIHVLDSARAFADAIEWEPGTYNVGGSNLKLEEIAATVSRLVGVTVETEYLRECDPGPSYHVDFGKVRAQGFVSEIGFEDGIADLVHRFQAKSPKQRRHA